ncbi:MAG: hypothetical protein GF365_04030 [Candidatus Buchananbacteria bacterium]|nr:hypothetical protein [Candidatus Buchananbacteria bacterium]
MTAKNKTKKFNKKSATKTKKAQTKLKNKADQSIQKSSKKVLKQKDKSTKTQRNKAKKKNSSSIFKSHKNEIEKDLKAIYQDEKGKLPKMTGLDFKKTNKNLRIIIYVIFLLIIIFTVSFLGFLIFQPAPKFTSEKVNLEIKAPFSVVSGEKIDYEIKYTNLEEISLTNAQLIIYFPRGFIFENANLEPTNNTNEQQSNIKTWQLNYIAPQKSDILEIKGRLIGQIDSKETISATLSYIPANFSSEFQKTNSFNTEISDSLIDLEINHPSQAAHQEETELNFMINNKAKEIDLQNLQIEFNYPPEFTISESQIIDPEEKEPLILTEAETEEIKTQKIIPIENLQSQSQKQIIIKGEFSVEERLDANFNLQVKLKGPAEEYFIQKQKNFTIDVIKGDLLTTLIIKGSNQNKPVDFDETLNYLLTLENKSKNTIGNIKVRAVLDSPFLDWAGLDDPNEGIREDQQILWTKEQMPALGVLFPEEEIEINFKINLQEFQESSRYQAEDYQVKSFFEAQINQIDNTETEVVQESNIIINEINTNLNLNASARYFSDNNLTIGSGPLPPVVGQETNYKIFWQINNSLHEITDIEVKAKLPDYVNFENQTKISTGDLYLNPNNEIIWQISRIPTSVKQSQAEFEISITPTEDDADKILTLLPEIALEATDSQTKDLLNKTVSGITTNLEGDPLAEGKGLVQTE